jgi:hypothetical protein
MWCVVWTYGEPHAETTRRGALGQCTLPYLMHPGWCVPQYVCADHYASTRSSTTGARTGVYHSMCVQTYRWYGMQVARRPRRDQLLSRGILRRASTHRWYPVVGTNLGI